MPNLRTSALTPSWGDLTRIEHFETAGADAVAAAATWAAGVPVMNDQGDATEWAIPFADIS